MKVKNFENPGNNSNYSESIDEGELNLNYLDNVTFNPNSNVLDKTIEIDERKTWKNNINQPNQEFVDLLNYVNNQNKNKIYQNGDRAYPLKYSNTFLPKTGSLKDYKKFSELIKAISDLNLLKLYPSNLNHNLISPKTNKLSRINVPEKQKKLRREERSSSIINLWSIDSKEKEITFQNSNNVELINNIVFLNKFPNSEKLISETNTKYNHFFSPQTTHFNAKSKPDIFIKNHSLNFRKFKKSKKVSSEN